MEYSDADVLRPPFVWINGICFRKNPLLQRDAADEEDDFADELRDECYDDEICDADIDIQTTENGFKLEMTVPSGYFKYIIGKKGETKKRLEYETQTQVRIPGRNQEGPIVISSRTKKGIASARNRIEMLVDDARTREPFTHFLSIPVTNDNIKESFLEFKDDILRECDGDRALDASLFQNPLKLHLTLGTLVLLDESEIQSAVSVLNNCQSIIEKITNGKPLKVDVDGLEYMNDDPNEVDVLYAKVQAADGSDRLQRLCDEIVNEFVGAGLLSKEYDHVKLHITVMNTIFRKDPSGTAAVFTARNKTPRESFDASNVLQKFGRQMFGSFNVPAIHLSQRYSTACNGYYSNSAIINLPS